MITRKQSREPVPLYGSAYQLDKGRLGELKTELRQPVLGSETESVPEFLKEVPGLTSVGKLVNLTGFYGDRYVFGALVPAIASARFNVTGIGSRPGL